MRGPSSSSSGPVARAINEDQRKPGEEWQLACWQRWPSAENWPGKLDSYETAGRAEKCRAGEAAGAERAINFHVG